MDMLQHNEKIGRQLSVLKEWMDVEQESVPTCHMIRMDEQAEQPAFLNFSLGEEKTPEGGGQSRGKPILLQTGTDEECDADVEGIDQQTGSLRTVTAGKRPFSSKYRRRKPFCLWRMIKVQL